MKGKYDIDEGHAAIIFGLSALLNAEVAGMTAINMQRAALGNSMAYDEVAFYQVMQPLQDYLKSCEALAGEQRE